MRAGIGAVRAGLRANAAMFVLVGMTAAFIGTSAAEGNAGRQLGLQRLPVTGLVRARHDAAGGSTNRGAIEVQPDAGDQVLDVLFRETGIGTGRAGLNAKRAGVDTSRDGVRVSRMFGMRSKHGAHD